MRWDFPSLSELCYSLLLNIYLLKYLPVITFPIPIFSTFGSLSIFTMLLQRACSWILKIQYQSLYLLFTDMFYPLIIIVMCNIWAYFSHLFCVFHFISFFLCFFPLFLLLHWVFLIPPVNLEVIHYVYILLVITLKILVFILLSFSNKAEVFQYFSPALKQGRTLIIL